MSIQQWLYCTAFARCTSWLMVARQVCFMQAYTIFAEMVGWDVPPILLEGREKLRVVAYMAKRVAKLDFEKHSVKVEPTMDGHKQISIICTFHVIVLPELLPIPTIKLKATVKLGVSDDFHKVRQLCTP